MIVSTEYEAKALNIDPDAIGARILAAGGQHVADRFMRRHVYDIPGYPTRWIGLGETGTETTLYVTQLLSDASGEVREVELEVTDPEAARAFLDMLGFTPKAYQENLRSSWLLGTARLEIHSWPLISPYLKIEADSAQEVREAAERLGISSGDLTAENTSAVYARYGYDLATIPCLRFPGARTSPEDLAHVPAP